MTSPLAAEVRALLATLPRAVPDERLSTAGKLRALRDALWGKER